MLKMLLVVMSLKAGKAGWVGKGETGKESQDVVSDL